MSAFLQSVAARNGRAESALTDFHGAEFKSVPDFFASVTRPMDGRWRRYEADIKATSGMSEFADSDGASLVPLAIRRDVWRLMLDDRTYPIAHVLKKGVRSNGYSLPAFPVSDASAGLYGFKTTIVDEGIQATATKVPSRKVTHKTYKRLLYIRATGELIEDSGLPDLISDAVVDTFRRDISVDILNGTGVGQPLGIAKAGCTVTISATRSGLTAGCIDGAAILKALAALTPDSLGRAVWFADPAVVATWIDSANAAIFSDVLRLLRFREPGAPAGSASMTLCGRDLYPSECMAAAGLSLMLIDPSAYLLVFGVPNIGREVPDFGETPLVDITPDFVPSQHCYFDSHEWALKYRMRQDGRPLFDSARTLPNGKVVSPFVVISPAA